MKEKVASLRGTRRCLRHRQLRWHRRHRCQRVKLTTYGGACSILGVTRLQRPLVLMSLTNHSPTLPLSMIGIYTLLFWDYEPLDLLKTFNQRLILWLLNFKGCDSSFKMNWVGCDCRMYSGDTRSKHRWGGSDQIFPWVACKYCPMSYFVEILPRVFSTVTCRDLFNVNVK